MKIFHNKTKYRIVIMVVLSMLLQIIGPVVSNVYAEGVSQGFRVTNIDIKDSTATISWEFDFELDDETKEYTHKGDFILEKPQEGEVIADDETLIGKYHVSKDGEITINIDDTLEDRVIEQSEETKEPAAPVEPAVPLEPAAPVEPEKPEGEEEPVVPEAPVEPQKPESGEEPDETEEHPKSEDTGTPEGEPNTNTIDNTQGAIGKPLRLVASTDEIESLPLGGEERKTYFFEGSFDVKGVVEKIQKASLGNDNFAQFLTDVEIKHVDTDGNAIEGKYTKDSQLRITYKYTLPDIEGEDSTSFKVNTDIEYKLYIPTEIKIIESQVIDLYYRYEGEDILLATVTVGTDNQAAIKFDENVNNYEYGFDRGGTFTIKSIFGEIDLNDDGKGTIEFELGSGKKDITVEFEKEVVEVNIGLKKTGKYNDKTHEIDWTIEIKPNSIPENTPIENLVITDTLLGDNHHFYSESNPTIEPSVEGEFIYDPNNGKTLEFKFTNPVNTTPEEKYTIKFKTKPDILKFEEDKTITFWNRAEAEYDGMEGNKPYVDADDSIDVNYIDKKGEFKEGSTRDEDRIKWTIAINSNNFIIPAGATIEDVIPDGLELDEYTVKLLNDKDEEVTGLGTSTYDSGSRKLIYTFNREINEPYKLTFLTKITDPNAYISNNPISFKNKATLTWSGGAESGESGNVGVPTSLIEKRGTGIDTTNHIMKWEILVNRNKIKVKNPVVTDTIPEGLKYIERTFKAKKDNGQFVDITEGFSYDENTRVFIYDFTNYKTNNEIDTIYTLTFDTEVLNKDVYGTNGNKKFRNTVKLNGENIKESTSYADQHYNSKVIEKTVEYDYLTKRATWTIKVNQNKMEIKNAYVVDRIEDKQKFIGEVKINGTDAALGSSPEEKDSYYFDEDSNTFRYNFPESITPEQTITYVTEIANPLEFFKENGDKTISNTATLYGEDIKDGGVEGTSSKTIANAIVKKDGKLIKDEYRIEWDVIVNQNKVQINNPILEDILPEGLSLDTSSVKLFKMNTDSQGNLSQGEEISLTSDNIKYDANTRKFQFHFNQPIKDAYKLIFSTDIEVEFGASKTYENTINFKGSGVDENDTSKSIDVLYNESDGEAWGSSRGSITIVKIDENGNKLPDAIFELLDENGNVLKVSSETDEEGEALFRGLHLNRDYKIREKVSPFGYAISSEVYTFQLENNNDKKHITYSFKNTKIKGNIEFTKYGEENNPVEGAEFTLYNADDNNFENPILTIESDKYGKVKFEDIAFGSYKIKETKAPEGYLLSDTVLEATISEDGKTVKASPESISNVMIKGNFKLLKVRRNTTKPLSGAEITVYKKDGTKVAVGITGKDGYAIFEDLPYSEYYFVETKAPSGYYRNNDKHYFEIKDDGETVEKVLENRKRSPYEPPTDPTDPEEPVDPPEEPEEPEKPTEPPTDPEKPVDPTEPVDPEKPTEPPTEPEIPEEPEKPTEPEEPTIKEKTPKEKPVIINPEVPKGSTPEIVEEPKNGKVTFDEDGNWIYTPNPGFVGKDRFIVKVTHPDGTEEEVIIEIDVEPPLGGVEVPTLPKTGQLNSILFYIAGLFFIVVGIVLRKRIA